MQEIPQGFAMALAQNEKAVNAYAMMTQEEKEAVLEQAQNARSKGQMQKIIRSLEKDQLI